MHLWVLFICASCVGRYDLIWNLNCFSKGVSGFECFKYLVDL